MVADVMRCTCAMKMTLSVVNWQVYFWITDVEALGKKVKDIEQVNSLAIIISTDTIALKM
jgi:hypothetical protein